MTRPAFACGQALVNRANLDPTIWVLDGDLADSDGAEPFAAAYPRRFVMAGIAEQAMVTMAAGMSTCGLRPWVFSFAAFLCYRGYDQIRVGIAQTGLPVTLVGSHSGGCAGINGRSHQALNDIAVVASLPNIEIWAPGDSSDTDLAVSSILSGGKPAYIRYPREPLSDLGGNPSVCRWLGPPAEYAIISCGYGTTLARKAQQCLAMLGIPLGVIHCARILPLPSDDLKRLTANLAAIWTVEDHSSRGGLSSLLEEAGFGVSGKFAWPAEWAGGFGSAARLLADHGLDPAQIASRISEATASSRLL